MIKDTSKGQKIVAALYLVTGHLSDNDPMKHALRTQAVSLLILPSGKEKQLVADTIESLLGSAVLAMNISEKNASIISLEVRHYVALFGTDLDHPLTTLFAPTIAPEMSFNSNQTKGLTRGFTASHTGVNMSHTVKTSVVISESKTNRQDKILSFINDRKSAAIKDIAALFPETSEKTVQRELGVLVADGKIIKRGSKRWSVYMAMTA